jgi:DNA-binding Lrp family transcriptional regulator
MPGDRHGQEWDFWTSHGKVLLHVAQNGKTTVQEIADAVDLSERWVIVVLGDLAESGVLRTVRHGSRRGYEVAALRVHIHPLVTVSLEDFLRFANA